MARVKVKVGTRHFRDDVTPQTTGDRNAIPTAASYMNPGEAHDKTNDSDELTLPRSECV